MSLSTPGFERLIQRQVKEDDPVLLALDEFARARDPKHPGWLVGQFLHMMATSRGARRVLDLGAGYGCAAYWLCRAIGPDGELLLMEQDANNAKEAESFLVQGGFSDRIQVMSGDPDQLLLNVPGEFDVIYLNVHRVQFPFYFDRLISRLGPKGLFIAHGVGVASAEGSAEAADPKVQAVADFLDKVMSNPRLVTAILPVGEGLTVSYRIE